jgi:hypothetical protein
MELNFVDRTAQLLFSDLLRRSDDLTDARIKAIAETSFRRAVMLSEVRKDYVDETPDVQELEDVDWKEYRVTNDLVKPENAEDAPCKCDTHFETEEKVEPKVEPKVDKKKRTWTRRTDKIKVAAATIPAVSTNDVPKKKGRPKGSVNKKSVV